MDTQIFENMPEEYVERNVLRTLQNRIHEGNKAIGWWDTPREIGTLSEISEAMEGARKNLAGAIQEKIEYNAQRYDHSREARQGDSGKLF